mgnify:FL=1
MFPPCLFSLSPRFSLSSQVHFKVKPQTKMDKVLKAFCEKVDVDVSSVRLTFDGRRVEATSTPADLGLENGDVIDIVEQQVGGAF